MKVFFYYLFSVWLLLFFSRGSTEDNGVFFVMKNRGGAGMFSMFSDVLSLLDSYEKHLFQGIEVDFGKEGLYYDKNHGDNWWNYYCEPINFGMRTNVVVDYAGHYPGFSPIFFFKDREEAYLLIKKYIHFRPHIQEKIEHFKKAHFSEQFIIGLHYRGTDAPHSSPSYENYQIEVQKTIDSLGISDYKLFIASDEQPFIDYMSGIHPNRVCCQQNVFRSGKGGAPIHMSSTYSHYLQGEEAIIDCALLSNCSLMMLTYSNLSLWAALFNPYAPIIDVSKKIPVIQ